MISEKSYEFRSLTDWLVNNHPRDIVVPCISGTKHPAFRHKNQKWSWNCLARYTRSIPIWKFFDQYDIGILLHDICVIDIDDPIVALEFEERFPVLLSAPCELTKNGVHYFFERSDVCNADGYYDGARQVIQGVDFKTVCSNGTSGFVAVSPSTNKQWVRPIWEFDLSPIPDNLLKAVAKSKHERIELNIVFPDDFDNVLTIRDRRLAMHFDVFKVSIREFTGESIPIRQFAHSELKQLLFAMTHNITSFFPDYNNVQRVLSLASYLGINTKELRAFQVGGYVNWMVDVSCRIGNSIAQSMHQEALFRIGAVEDIQLCEITAHSMGCMDFDVITPNDDWWMFSGETTLANLHTRLKESVSVPCIIKDWLSLYPKNLVLAGGAALDAVVEGLLAPPSDFDFFIVGDIDEEEACQIVDSLTKDKRVVPIYMSKNAVTVRFDDAYTIQIITRRYKNGQHLLASFDVQPCKIMLKYDESRSDLIAYATTTWVWSVFNRVMIVSLDTWGCASYARILKYASRGFAVFIPCTTKSLIREDIASRNDNGIGQMFSFEKRRGSDASPYPTKIEVVAELKRQYKRNPLMRTSEYDTMKEITNTFSWFAAYVSSSHGLLFNTVKGRIPVAPRCSNFYPSKLNWGSAVKTKEWKKSFINAITTNRNLQELLSGCDID